ncbi:9928_t:CDS:1 [Ambispora gerdemannii]|uniref:9928_t:CDS:1 n=1 Tax=Ambispora gerdemannii TaxID=144530 RepID=A0A9N8ZYZ0_9GLOM|nr:9928_t:CDS:1 [Ambispora gerdemannii]
MAITKTSDNSNNAENSMIKNNEFNISQNSFPFVSNTLSINEGFDPETLYFEDFDGVYYEEPEENYGNDYFSYVSDCSSDVSSTAEDSIYSTDSSISTHESDNFLSYSRNISISKCSFPNKDDKESTEISINTTEKFFHMTPKDYRISLINFYKQRICVISRDFYNTSNH